MSALLHCAYDYDKTRLVVREMTDILVLDLVDKVTGNTCKRGADYGKKEVTDPTRIVTSTVRVQGGTLPVVSVKTRGDIPKSSVMDCVLAESYVK